MKSSSRAGSSSVQPRSSYIDTWTRTQSSGYTAATVLVLTTTIKEARHLAWHDLLQYIDTLRALLAKVKAP